MLSSHSEEIKFNIKILAFEHSDVYVRVLFLFGHFDE